MTPLWKPLAAEAADPRPGDPFPSPFDDAGPSPVARRAAHLLQAELRSGLDEAGLAADAFDSAQGGKMFGVLVARAPDGRLGFLRAFSGTLGGHFDVPGFAPPVFDRAARDAVEVDGERMVSRLTARAVEYAQAPDILAAREEAAAVAAERQAARSVLAERHAARRRERHEARALLERSSFDDAAREALLADLAQRSRADKAEKRRLDAWLQAERDEAEHHLAAAEHRLHALSRLHRLVSRRLMKRIHDTYRLVNARGETKSLRELFAPVEPPGGAGDCAGPKLLVGAQAHGLVPVAMAEFWWGAPPSGGGRRSGVFYPACREKCGPILPFLLEGLEVTEPRPFVPPLSEDLELTVLFEDDWIVVVEKPAGLLSVPGRDENSNDSVLSRLRWLFPDATGPLLVHRLDLATSGLLLAAKDPSTHAALQKQFLERTVEKGYVAILDGAVQGDGGLIELALRVDVNDRPRQVHDAEHGKTAVTEWRVLSREPDGRTRVALSPRTGRTHQLRAHVAHPLGLGVPVAGDRLYGHGEGATRLMLHAETLAFTHPATGDRVHFHSHPPF